MTTDKQLTVQAAAKDGHYQIVCRHQFAAMNSWYITLADVDDWDWNVNEYRIFVGTREPPMINEMNDYSVYFCGYTYFFIDNDDGQVKSVTNVNFTEFGEQYTSFLKCEKIQVDKVYSNETGKVTVEDSLSINKGLDVSDDVIANANVSVSKNLSTSGNLSVSGESQFSKKVVMESDLNVNSDFYLSGEFYNTNNMRVTGDASIDTSLKTPDIYVNNISRLSGSGSVVFKDGIQVEKDLIANANVSVSKNLSTSGNLNVSGESQFGKKVVMDSDLNVNSDFYLSGEFYSTNNMRVTGAASIETSLKTPDIYVNSISKLSGSNGVVFNDDVIANANVNVSKNLSTSGNLSVSGDTNLQGKLEVSSQSNFKDNATFNKDLTVDGFINGIKIRII